MTSQLRNVILGLIATTLLFIGGAFWYSQTSVGPIQPYDSARDKSFIMKVFKDNWYWLISDYSPDFNVEFMLDHSAYPPKDMSTAGKLILKTYVVDGKPVGFIHYYIKEFKVGQILFLGVSEEQRGKGYARKLMNYAINDLKKSGMLTIRMNTRTDNARARKLYDSLGFKQIWTDGAYIIYELVL